MRKKIIIGAVAAALLYVASPYFAAWSIYHSATTGDALALDDKIDWVSVRAGLKEQLNAALVAGAVKNADKDGFATGLMTAGPVVIDRAVDTYANSQNLIQYLREDEERRAHQRKMEGFRKKLGDNVEDQLAANEYFQNKKGLTLETDKVDYAFFTSPTRFRLSIGDRNKSVLSVLMRFSLGGWEVYRVGVPEAVLKEMG